MIIGGFPTIRPSHLSRSGFIHHPHELGAHEQNSRPDHLDIFSTNGNQARKIVTNQSAASPNKASPARPIASSSPPPLPPRSQFRSSSRSCSQGGVGKKKLDPVPPWSNWSPTGVENRSFNLTVATQTPEPLSTQTITQSPARPRKQLSSTA